MVSRKRSKGIRVTNSERVYDVFVYIMITLLGVICLYPYLNVMAKSFSGAEEVLSGKVMGILPKGFNLEAYAMTIKSERFVRSAGNTVFITVVGTLLNVMLTYFVAYATSRKRLPGSKLIMTLYIITMMFSGGMIPTYFVIINAGLRNSLWSLILPGLVVPYNLILMRNYMAALPGELEESASIDGASQWTVMFRILLPLTLPSIATIVLFCAVSQWNSYFNALLYIDDRSKTVLQQYIRELLASVGDAEKNGGDVREMMHGMPTETVRAACVVCATLPILCVYPFLQKYYIKGMTLGAVKG